MTKKVNENTEEGTTPAPVKTDKFDALSSFIVSTLWSDDAAASANFNSYLIMKSREILGTAPVTEHAQRKEEEFPEEDEDEDEKKYAHLLKNRDKKKAPLKKMKKDLNEQLVEFAGATSPITLKGDDVFVNGKMVGTVINDLNDVNAGIKFQSADGKVNEEFEDIRSLYQFLIGHFNVNSETPLDADQE